MYHSGKKYPDTGVILAPRFSMKLGYGTHRKEAIYFEFLNFFKALVDAVLKFQKRHF